MAMHTHTLLITTLTMLSGMAIAGEHGDTFSSCGSDVQSQSRVLVGAGIMPFNSLEYHLTDEQIAALNEPQKELLLAFERGVFNGEMAPHVCVHPDTPPKVAEAIEVFLNDLWFDFSPNSFILSTRWTGTATNGAGLNQGDPTTLTYSFIPDGTNIVGEGSSNLHSFMNSQIGAGTWQNRFATALGEWSDVSGLNYVYEPNDDGVNLSGGGAAGVLGVRGDVRIGGNFIDGNSGILAYNYFPNGGDMVIDTGDGSFYGNGSNSHIRLRNVVTHEAGHGIGLSHVESDSNRFLMEPFIDISFVGPQIDDIRGAQRGYGDMDENNNSFGAASNYNSLTNGGAPFVGSDFPNLTLRSTDDNTDTDYFAVTTGEPVTMTVILSPSGGSYQYTSQGGGGGGAFFNATSVSDLKMTINDPSTSILQFIDETGDGEGELALIELPEPGQYYIVVSSDNTNNIQTYNLGLIFQTLEVEDCPADFTGDGNLDFFDVSAFLTAFGNEDPSADFTGEGSFDFFDVSAYLSAFSAGCP
jgi:serralysin